MVKKQNFTYSVPCKRRNLFPVFLLLCGDVHPCLGPMGSQFASRSDFQCFDKKGLHFVHLNVRSLLPKIDELRMLARDSRAACICITETWLDGTVFDSEIHIDNYSVRRREKNRHGGGVCLYIRSDLAFNGLDELWHDEIEAVWIELLLPKTKPIVCSVVYRPPHQSNFYDLFEDVCLSSTHIQEREGVVLGDFNTNVTGSQRCKLKTSLNSCLDLLNWTQIKL